MKLTMVTQVLLLILSGLNFSACDQSNKDQDIIDGPGVVVGVKVSGEENSYNFSVTIKSPDTGCDQYANWWEVISADGKNLLYRRILAHSHVGEQPFTRSGGTIDLSEDTEVIIRAHMFPTGYGEGEITMIGSVSKGFTMHSVSKGFGSRLEDIAPQPSGCAF